MSANDDHRQPAPEMAGAAPHLRRFPGAAIAVVTALDCALLIQLYYGRWPFGERLAYLANAIIAVPAVSALVGLATGWLVRVVKIKRSTGPFPVSLALAPLVVFAALTVVIVYPRAGFSDARVDMEALAASIVSSGVDGPRCGVEVDGLRFGSVERRADGCVYFVEADQSISTTGWVYTGECVPESRGYVEFKSVAPHWARFEYGT